MYMYIISLVSTTTAAPNTIDNTTPKTNNTTTAYTPLTHQTKQHTTTVEPSEVLYGIEVSDPSFPSIFAL